MATRRSLDEPTAAVDRQDRPGDEAVAHQEEHGDIVISTPKKCGTTWTQMLCALLIFDGAHFPKPLEQLSPWLDMRNRPIEDVRAALARQTHRRFIKTHTPLDGSSCDETSRTS
jgi:hypothetical protein